MQTTFKNMIVRAINGVIADNFAWTKRMERNENEEQQFQKT